MPTFRLIVFFGALLFTSGTPAVCLLSDYSVQAEYARSEAVVLAKAVSERTVPDKEDQELIGGTFYQVKVLESFRGSHAQNIDVWSENSSGRFPLGVGKTYLLFLYRQEGLLRADYCGNSGPVETKAGVLDELRRLSKSGQAR